MRPNMLRFWALGLSLLLGAGPVLAHHSFMSEFDLSKPITVKGVLTKVEFINPHAVFYLDVIDERGEVTNWIFESASPNVLLRSGWTRNSLTPGDLITVDGHRAKNGTALGVTRTVTLADGRKLPAHSDGVRP